MGWGRVNCAANRSCAVLRAIMVECLLPVRTTHSFVGRREDRAACSPQLAHQRTTVSCARAGRRDADPPARARRRRIGHSTHRRHVGGSSGHWGARVCPGGPRHVAALPVAVCRSIRYAPLSGLPSCTVPMRTRTPSCTIRRLAFAVYVGLSSLHESASGYSGAYSLQSAGRQRLGTYAHENRV